MKEIRSSPFHRVEGAASSSIRSETAKLAQVDYLNTNKLIKYIIKELRSYQVKWKGIYLQLSRN